MKRLLNKFTILLVGLMVMAQGCEKDFTSINTDPTSAGADKFDPNSLLTSAQLRYTGSTDFAYETWRTNLIYFSVMMQHLSNVNGYWVGDKSRNNPGYEASYFERAYDEQVKYIIDLIQFTEDKTDQYKNLHNAAHIMRALIFHRLTDIYGDVPYSEAGLGFYASIYTPAYDTQESIYKDMLKELDAAANGFDAGADQLSGDLIFNGDFAKWKKFANSLMLRLAMRLTKVDEATAKLYAEKAIAGGVMTSNADNVIVPMATGPSEWTNQNGISRAFYPGDGGQPSYLSKTLVDWLKGPSAGSTTDDDPRLMIMSGGIINWSPTDVTIVNADPLAQKGMPNGKDATTLAEFEGLPAGQTVDQPNTYSRINTKMLDDGDPYMLMSYGEVELLLAEAAERSIGGASGAEGHYKAGVKASCQMYTIYDETLTASDAAVDAYLAARPYGGNKLQMIGEQLWANKFLNWWDAWADWRRTGFPVLTPTNYPGNETGGVIPQRLKYPVGEVAGNPNFDAGATKPNNYVTKVWWAGGPE